MDNQRRNACVMLSADIVESIKRIQGGIERNMRKVGIYGQVDVPSVGSLSRYLLRESLGLRKNKEEWQSQNGR